MSDACDAMVIGSLSRRNVPGLLSLRQKNLALGADCACVPGSQFTKIRVSEIEGEKG